MGTGCRRLLGYLTVLVLGSVLLVVALYSTQTTESKIVQIFKQPFEYRDSDKAEVDLKMDRVEELLRQQRSMIESLSCKVNSIGIRGGFCLSKDIFDVGGNSWWDFQLAKNLDQVFKGQSVGDLGAGLGWYGRFWLRKQEPLFISNSEVEEKWYFNRTDVMDYVNSPQIIRSWQGFDGAGNVEEVTNGFVNYLDLTDRHDLPVKYDWVISLEVGEHIPHIYENIFVENIVQHACKGVVLSWAVEGQGGHFHVNNHNNDYVKRVFEEKGFQNNLEIEDKLRNNVVLGYFKNTLMVFERRIPLNHPKCLRNTPPQKSLF